MVAGFVNVGNNDGATVVDIGSLEDVDNDLIIRANGSVGDNDGATVIINSLDTVGGDLTIETAGSGTFDVDGADVEGDTSLSTTGYTEVDAATAAGQTALTMINSQATMEVMLPDGAFTSEDPVTFSVTQLPGSVETVGDDTITHLATYAFDFAIPTLNSAATLNFEIDLAVLAEPERLALLDLLDAGAELTLGVRGDVPEAELQLFDVCAGGGPMVDACVVVQWLDENRMLLDPLGGIDPAILRLEGLVGHFSIYSFLAVTLAGDYNRDGTVDEADYTVWRDTLGQMGAGLAADGNDNDQIDAGDYDVWKSHFGNTAGSGSGAIANVTVPEPAAAMLLIVATSAAFFLFPSCRCGVVVKKSY
jgi:hypothetical protein